MVKKRLALGFFMLAVCTVGCGKKDTKTDIVNPTTNEIHTEEAGTSEETTTEPEKIHTITGITRYQSGEISNENGDVSLICKINFNAQIDDKRISDFDLAIIDDKLIYSYVLSEDNNSDMDEGKNDLTDNIYEAHIAELDKNTYEVIKDVTVSGQISHVDNLDNGIMCANGYSGGYSAIFYDSNLEKKYEFNIDEMMIPYFSADTEYLYYLQGNDVFRYLISSNDMSTIEKVKLPDNILCSALGGVYTDNDGNDYIEITGMGTDLKNYKAIYDVDRGVYLTIEKTEDMEISSIFQRYGVTVKSTTSLEDNTNSFEMYNGSILANGYKFKSSETNIDMTVMSNGDAYAYYYADGKMEVAIFDKADGSKKYNTAINIDVQDEYFYGYVRQLEPVVVGDNKVLLMFSDCNTANYVYEWKLGNSTDGWNELSLYSTYAELTPEVEMEYICSPDSLLPRPLTEDFLDLRARADMIEEKYGIDVYIGTECQMVCGGYVAVALNDKDLISRALDIIDKELSVYKRDFLKEVDEKGAGPLNIYVTGQLIGVGGGLDYAGGFQNEENGESNIFIDCTYDQSIGKTFHHEFSHMVFDVIQLQENMDMDVWASLNPVLPDRDEVYSLNYSEFGYPEGFKYTIGGSTIDDFSEAYFVDSYSMTYPTEDVARIFENLLGRTTMVDLSIMPKINAKYEYYVECMDKTFDSITADEIKQW